MIKNITDVGRRVELRTNHKHCVEISLYAGERRRSKRFDDRR